MFWTALFFFFFLIHIMNIFANITNGFWSRSNICIFYRSFLLNKNFTTCKYPPFNIWFGYALKCKKLVNKERVVVRCKILLQIAAGSIWNRLPCIGGNRWKGEIIFNDVD